jgi:hypothetical protein
LASVQLWVLAALLALPGCGPGATIAPSASAGSAGSEAASGAGGASDTNEQVLLGVPGGTDGLSFEPFVDGMELRLETFGQGGTHVLLGVRCIGFGSRAFVSITLRDSNTGSEIVAPAPARAQLLFCDGDNCDLVPITVMAGGLTATNEERDGLPIEVSAEVHNDAGVMGTGTATAVLSTADL